jgi:hypothetical protein
MRKYAIWIVIALLLANMVVGIGVLQYPSAQDTPDGSLALVRPWFVDTVSANDERTARAIEDISAEAGMSAYVKSASAINLTNAKKAFTKGVEMETADYIIGLVPITGYEAKWDVHVFVHRTGWILAYYPNTWVTAAALNEKHQIVGGSTKLSLAIDSVGSKIGQNFSTKSYYNFAQPSATKMLVIYFKNQNPRLMLPSSYTYAEKSLIFYETSWCNGFKIGDKLIANPYGGFAYVDISSDLTEGGYVQTTSSFGGSCGGSWGMIVILYS